MNRNHQILKQAIQRELPVMAQIKLLDGQERIRVGPVANLTNTHVTIYDLGKGFRTTPLGLVHRVQIQEPTRSVPGMVFKHLMPKGK